MKKVISTPDFDKMFSEIMKTIKNPPKTNFKYFFLEDKNGRWLKDTEDGSMTISPYLALRFEDIAMAKLYLYCNGLVRFTPTEHIFC